MFAIWVVLWLFLVLAALLSHALIRRYFVAICCAALLANIAWLPLVAGEVFNLLKGGQHSRDLLGALILDVGTSILIGAIVGLPFALTRSVLEGRKRKEAKP
jgi:hypothetical protein